MTIDLRGQFDFHQFVDVKNGTISRQIFADEAIYQMELERIFARAWNFMCHESQIPNPGDFFLSYIGEESVICVRDKKGGLQTFLNSCRHRGNAVCRAEQGNTRSFLCTYHGWTYDLEGKLIGVPGYKDLYHEQLDRSQWGLVSAGKVQSYNGFVFANMDPAAPELDEYLGPVGRLGLDMIAARGEIKAFEGVRKNIITCNWKLAADNIFDWYHAPISHASAFQSMDSLGPANDRELTTTADDPKRQRVAVGSYGHAIGGPRLTEDDLKLIVEKHAEMPDAAPHRDFGWRGRPRAQEMLGAVESMHIGHPHIFPNLWVSPQSAEVCLRIPRGPSKTEFWWFAYREDGLSPEIERARLGLAEHVFGPAGMLEQDDGENWDQSTRSMRGVIAGRYPINFQMGLGQHAIQTTERGVPYTDTPVNEHGQLWTWNAWADWMSAESWDELALNKTPIPERL